MNVAVTIVGGNYLLFHPLDVFDFDLAAIISPMNNFRIDLLMYDVYFHDLWQFGDKRSSTSAHLIRFFDLVLVVPLLNHFLW